MFKAIILDMGGVIRPPPEPVLNRDWERRLGLSKGELVEVMFTNPILDQGLIGKVPAREWLEDVRNKLSITTEVFEEYLSYRRTAQSWDDEFLEYIDGLRPKYKTGLLSNTFPGRCERVIGKLENFFDVCIFSAEVGVAKPYPEIYEMMLTELDIQAEEAIYVDDLKPNVDTASALGMHGIHYDGSFILRDEISRLLLESQI